MRLPIARVLVGLALLVGGSSGCGGHAGGSGGKGGKGSGGKSGSGGVTATGGVGDGTGGNGTTGGTSGTGGAPSGTGGDNGASTGGSGTTGTGGASITGGSNGMAGGGGTMTGGGAGTSASSGGAGGGSSGGRGGAGGTATGGAATGGAATGGAATGGAATGGAASGGAPATGGNGSGGSPVSSLCGNSVVDSGEGCDIGALNGTFFGDGTGCSKTCTREPRCRDGATTRACDVICGNGAVEMGEDCDDGNHAAGDGCSPTCTVEAGFTCMRDTRADTKPCVQPGNSGQCLSLPMIYRDFKNESASGGHPDFFYFGATINNPPSIAGVQGQGTSLTYNKRYCVADTSGPARKDSATNRCWDLAQTTLDASGKPAFNAARTGGTNCDCQFVDWSHDSNGGHVPGYTTVANSPLYGLTYTAGPNGHPMYRGPAPVVTSANSFGQWWIDSVYTDGTHKVGTLEMNQTGGGEYRYASQTSILTGGFFPLDPPGQFPLYGSTTGGGPGAVRMVGTEALVCNIWPYWYSSAGFGAGAGCLGDQYILPWGLIPPDTGAQYPDGKWYPHTTGWYHNEWFTYESHIHFVHSGAFSVQVYATNDQFVYINGTLVIDLGGTHNPIPGRVDVSADGFANVVEGGALNAAGTTILPCPSASPYTGLTENLPSNNDGFGNLNCTIGTCDCRARTINLGLVAGRTYEIAIFGAQRHPPEATLQVTLNGLTSTRSVCTR